MASHWSAAGNHSPTMQRSEVVQAFVDLYRSASYLEIGVSTGATFHAIRADRKCAVDPRFAFDLDHARSAHRNAVYHQTSSDDFFDSIVGDERFHVVFIDGLHTYEQCLRDLLNAIIRLESGGVIIIDDVKPLDYASSLPDETDARNVRDAFGDPDRRWMGDVYKVVFFIAGYLGGFTFATVNETYGQTVLWRGARPVASDLSLERISQLQFYDTVRRSDVYRLASLNDIVGRFRDSVKAEDRVAPISPAL